MSADPNLLAYTARLADNALILGQRMIEAVTLYPELEEELANANFALDYIGQARLFYTYAGELEDEGPGFALSTAGLMSMLLQARIEVSRDRRP